MTKPKDGPKQAGGRRPGAGRPLGAKGKRTLGREAKIQEAVDAALAALGKDGLAAMEPLAVLLLGMRLMFEVGDIPAAMAAAAAAAPYRHSKQGTLMPVPPPVPDDLLPDPPLCNDEPGPPEPVL